MRFYSVLDFKRGQSVYRMECETDELAKAEFGWWYQNYVGMARWETRKFGRFVLAWMGFADADGVYHEAGEGGEGKPIMLDIQVRLSYSRFRAGDPPGDAEEERELEADFERLDALDRERLELKANAIRSLLGEADAGASVA